MISIVVPLFNEQDSLEELIRQIQQAVQTDNLGSYEVLLIDDGSNDLSWSVIEKISQKHSMVHGIRFRRNFGKAAALAAGFSAAKGELVVTMDADLQDDPKELVRLVEKLDSGNDVVSGWKQTRYDPWHKRWPSLVMQMESSRLPKNPIEDKRWPSLVPWVVSCLLPATHNVMPRVEFLDKPN